MRDAIDMEIVLRQKLATSEALSVRRRDQIHKQRKRLDEEIKARGKWKARAENAEAERDEARAMLGEEAAAHAISVAERDSAVDCLGEAEEGRTTLRARVEELEAERDGIHKARPWNKPAAAAPPKEGEQA